MTQAFEIVANLKQRINELISKHEALQATHSLQIQENEKLKTKLIEKESQLKELEHKYANLKIASSMAGTGDGSKIAKDKIGQIVREIDKCIGMLNK